jgi:hypothetical protein
MNINKFIIKNILFIFITLTISSCASLNNSYIYEKYNNLYSKFTNHNIENINNNKDFVNIEKNKINNNECKDKILNVFNVFKFDKNEEKKKNDIILNKPINNMEMEIIEPILGYEYNDTIPTYISVPKLINISKIKWKTIYKKH